MNIQELLESSKIENKDNIIKFLSANSYEEYKIIDENNCEVIINENEKIIIPNELIYSFVNICAPYNDVLKECVELFLNENNIILDESTSLANPNIFGALLISTENIDLFKDWYEYKNLLLNEDCMYINADDRVNILAQYLSINESFNEEKFLQLEVPDQFLNETIIGSVNGLYDLLVESFLSKKREDDLINGNYNLRSYYPALKKYAEKMYGKNGYEIEHLEGKKNKDGKFEYFVVKGVKDNLASKSGNAFLNRQVFRVNKYNNRPEISISKVIHHPNNRSASKMEKFDTATSNFLFDPKTERAIRIGAAAGKVIGKGIKNGVLGTIGLGRIAAESGYSKTKQFFKKVKNSDRYKKIKDSAHKGIIGATTSTLNKINSIPQTVRNRFTPELGWKKGLFSVKPVHNIK